VLVVVLAVRGVPAPVVHVVDMVPVRHGHMTTAVTVDVVVILMHGVAGRFAFVVVIVVPSMKVTVVHVVDMVPMRDGDMAASFAVDMVMIDVFAVSCVGHRCLATVLGEFRLVSRWHVVILVLLRPSFLRTTQQPQRSRSRVDVQLTR
jgi:hypothetical protein